MSSPVPSRNVRAYRRRWSEGQQTYIALDNAIFEIDETFDRLWKQVDGKRSVEELAALVFDQGDAESVPRTREMLDELAKLGIILWGTDS